jgi:CubicO group peptidase (beta-lactamase class C family)
MRMKLVSLAALNLLMAMCFAENSLANEADRPIVKGELGAKLDDYMERLAKFGFSGVLLAAKDHEVILAKGYGLANREKKLPFTTQTVVSVGSITKQFTAAAILKLQMQGKLRVTEPISKYFPNVPPDKSAITSHHLLTHTAGLESDFGPSDFEPVTRDEIVKRALASKLRSIPGKAYVYSNAGYSLLGAIVELISRQGYEVFLNEQLFKPAGMTQTGYRIPRWAPDRAAQGYLRGGQRWGTILERPWAADGPYWNLRANGAIHTTIGDMYLWHRALEGETVLSSQAKEKMFAAHVAEEPGGDSFYGYGWAIATTPRHTTVVAHNGGNGIFAADFRRWVDERVVVFIASNNAEAPATRICNWIARLIFGGNYPVPPTVLSPASANLDRYAGTYKLASGDKYIVTPKDGTLKIKAEGSQAFALLVSGKAGAAERLKAASQRTAVIADAQVKRDYSALYKALGGKIPLERIKAMQTRHRALLEDEHGALKSFEVLASVPEAEGDIETYVRLKSEREPAIICYHWEGQQLRGIGIVQVLPAEHTFLPESTTDFASFNFDSPASVHIRFQSDPKGAVTGLQVGTGGSNLTATKVEADSQADSGKEG